MGSQCSTSQHQGLSDAHQSGIPGIPQLQDSGTSPVAGSAQSKQGPTAHMVGESYRSNIDTRQAGGPQESIPGHQYQQGLVPQRGMGTPAGPEEQMDTDEYIPCVFTWSHGGHSVFLTGSFSNWSTETKSPSQRLARSGHEFSVIKELPRGVHLYKFIVDDQWKYAPDQRTQSDQHGNINNVLDISKYTRYNFHIPTDQEQAAQAVYHQYIPNAAEHTSDAPPVPILLSKSVCVAADPPPPRLSIPVHCLANHVYHDEEAIKCLGPQVSAVAVTQRWRYEAPETPCQIPSSPKTCERDRHATHIFVTLNPLCPTHLVDEKDGAAAESWDEWALRLGHKRIINPLAGLFIYAPPSMDTTPMNVGA